MARKKKETVLGVPVLEEVKVKKKPGRRKKAEVVEPVVAPHQTEPQVTIRDNQFFTDTNSQTLNISREENINAALEEAGRSAIYISPALISITNVTILTGYHAELWNRYWTWHRKWIRVTESVRRFFRHLTRWKKQ